MTRPGLAAVAILSLAAVLAPAPAVAERPPADAADRTLSPYFVIENGDPSIDRLPLRGTAVHIDVAGVIASVTVSQTYANDGKRPINARYVFPGSTRAAVHGLRMKVGDEVVIAKIKEREEARATYEKAREEGKNAALLEQDRPNVFAMNLANVMPGQRIEVELRYSELLVPTDGVYEVVYPTVVGPRYASDSAPTGADAFVASGYTRAGVPPAATLALRATLAAGLPIREVGSPSHHVSPVASADLTRVAVLLDPSEAAGGNRDFILRYKLAGAAVQSGLLLEDGPDENTFLIMAQPPARVTPEAITAREYVFILDVSGSMVGWPLDTAKDLMADLVVRLRPMDTFNVILFSGDAQLLAPRSLPATPDNIEAAVRLVDSQRGGGGTELNAAVAQAFAIPADPQRARSFVIITDGYISAEKDVFDTIRTRLGDASFFAFGIGSSVNRYLIEGIARAGQGEPFIVTEADKTGEAAFKLRKYIEAPVLTHVKLEAEGFEIYDVEPASIPDVFASRPVVVHGKWRGARRGKLKITGTAGGGAYSQTFDVAAARVDHGEALRLLWARTRIATLSDFADRDDSARQEVTALGLKYHLLTRFTSFIAVREKIVNPDAPAADVDQPLPLPQGVSELAVADTSVESGDEPELLLLALVLGAVALVYVRRRAAA